MITRTKLQFGLSLILALFLAACGGGGDGGGGGTSSGSSDMPVSSLAGTWYGSYQYGAGAVPFRLAVDVNASGGITAVRRGGTNSTNGTSANLTGTIQNVGGSKFRFVLSDTAAVTTVGGFLVDSAGAHAGFLDEDGSIGALQKGATVPPLRYDFIDIAGTWSGYTVALNSSMNVVTEGGSNATVAGSTATGSDFNGTFTASIPSGSISSTYGFYPGTWSNATGSGNLRVFLSPDKRFAAEWACQGGVTYPNNFDTCTFAIWNKQ
jgi:hypothetical protein